MTACLVKLAFTEERRRTCIRLCSSVFAGVKLKALVAATCGNCRGRTIFASRACSTWSKCNC